MRARNPVVITIIALVVAAAGCDGSEPPPDRDGGRRGDASGDGRITPGADVRTGPCVDTDNDGIEDALEAMAGGANDNDGDGFTDEVETAGNYPGYSAMRPPVACGARADDCDMDGVFNWRDTDADNDGLTDAEELAAMTNPCAADTDMDGIDDLTERVAMSDPRSMMSRPPEGSLYVVLPYHPPGEMGEHPLREFPFSTRIRAADIMFLVDTTGSMGATIAAVQNSLSTTIIPGIRTALGMGGDARYGLAAHGDFAEGGFNQDGAVTIYQRLDPNPALAQAATMRLRAAGGGDGPESMVPAMYALIHGAAFAGYPNPGAPPAGGVSPNRMVNPMTDCGASPDEVVPFGWGCFRPGRVPIMVLFSDAEWHNGPTMPANFYGSVPGTPTYTALEMEMVRRGGYFVGIDVGFGATFMHSQTLARATRTLDGMGQPIAFRGAPATVAANVVDAITRIAGQSRQDITTRVDADRMEMRLMAPRTTRDFIRAVTPLRGVPEMPMGYDRRDMTTFYNVAPSTQVIFQVDFYNDFQPGGSTAQVFRAKIVVLGRAMSEVDSRDVFMVVPAMGGGPPG